MGPSAKPDGGAPARDRLIQAGIDVFGQYGYEAATTRMIAKQAGANIAAIPYYFEGKEGLYRAVVEYISDHINAALRPTLLAIKERASRENLAPAEAQALVETLLGEMVDFMVGGTEVTRFVRIISREHLYPSAAYDIIFQRVMGPVLNALAVMLAAATGKPLTETMRLRAVALVGQIMVFRIAKEAMIRAMGFTAYSPEETRMIREMVLEHTRVIIASIAAA